MTATVLLVHGAFHGAWCWAPVLEGLAARGVAARALDLPGRGACPEPRPGLVESAAAVAKALAAIPGPVVVCGHSFGGAVVSEAVEPQGGVRHLVYLAAIVPDRGQTVVAAVPELAEAPLASAVLADPEGAIVVPRERAAELFYHDCEPELAARAVGRLCPESPWAFATPLSRAAWRSLPSTYVICQEDRALGVPPQERLATRCDRTLRWPTSHSPMLSRPERVVDLLAELAAARG